MLLIGRNRLFSALSLTNLSLELSVRALQLRSSATDPGFKIFIQASDLFFCLCPSINLRHKLFCFSGKLHEGGNFCLENLRLEGLEKVIYHSNGIPDGYMRFTLIDSGEKDNWSVLRFFTGTDEGRGFK